MKIQETILKQVKEVWSKLVTPLELALIHDGKHEKEDELRAFLEQFQAQSEKVSLREVVISSGGSDHLRVPHL